MQVKGLCHIHSIHSHDGEISLAELKEYFKKKGFQFLLLTEHIHDISEQKIQEIINDCRSLSDDEFIIVPGLELDDNDKHFLIIGIDKFEKNAEEIIRKPSPNKMIILAHPFYLGAIKEEEIIPYSLDGIEIWNSVYDGKAVPGWQALKLLKKLCQRKNLYGFGGLDFHRFSHAGGPFLMIELQNLSQNDILENLRLGNFFIQRGNFVIKSDGSLSAGQKIKTILVSPFITSLLAIIRLVSKILFILKIAPPKKAKELIRSKL